MDGHLGSLSCLSRLPRYIQVSIWLLAHEATLPRFTLTHEVFSGKGKGKRYEVCEHQWTREHTVRCLGGSLSQISDQNSYTHHRLRPSSRTSKIENGSVVKEIYINL